MVYKHIGEYEDREDPKLKIAIQNFNPELWYIVDYAEDCVQIFECPTKADAEKLLYNFHTEGSHTDNDTYEIYHAGKQKDYRIAAIII